LIEISLRLKFTVSHFIYDCPRVDQGVISEVGFEQISGSAFPRSE
jgi:hypothetical protein